MGAGTKKTLLPQARSGKNVSACVRLAWVGLAMGTCLAGAQPVYAADDSPLVLKHGTDESVQRSSILDMTDVAGSPATVGSIGSRDRISQSEQPRTGDLAPDAIDIPLPSPIPAFTLDPIPAKTGEKAQGPAQTLAQVLQQTLEEGSVFDQPRLSSREREAIKAFYAHANYEPLWLHDAAWTERAHSVLDRLSHADEDGLKKNDYRHAGKEGGSLEDQAKADIRLSNLAVLYARDARGGRIVPEKLSIQITPTLYLPDADSVLGNVLASSDAGARLAAYNPPHAGYQALKAALAAARRQSLERQPDVERSLPGKRVEVETRVRFAKSEIEPSDVPHPGFQELVAPAGAKLLHVGIISKNQEGEQDHETISLPSALLTKDRMGPRASAQPQPLHEEANIIANMERWRWLPTDLGHEHVLVNIPEFTVRVVRDGAIAHSARVIVGKPETPTPIFSDEMEYLIVNPSWYIPPSILKKEFLPKLAADPSYAERNGYEVITRNGNISIRQPPGERNALGHIKFMFPNDHSVYLHDTPSRALFAADRRAYSHGCVRVDQPLRFADIILKQTGGWSEERVSNLIGKGERTIFLKEHIPVHLTYFTMGISEDGQLHTREDIYGYDRRIKSALGLSG